MAVSKQIYIFAVACGILLGCAVENSLAAEGLAVVSKAIDQAHRRLAEAVDDVQGFLIVRSGQGDISVAADRSKLQPLKVVRFWRSGSLARAEIFNSVQDAVSINLGSFHDARPDTIVIMSQEGRPIRLDQAGAIARIPTI
jgi:hypothetical protein